MYVAKRTDKGFDVNRSTRIYGSSNIAVAFVLLNQDAAAAPDGFRVFYRVVVTKKLPENVANLIAALRLPTIAKGHSTNRAAFYGKGFIDNVAIPSDISLVAGHVIANKQEEKEAPHVRKTFKFDNEGRHTWDISVGIPVTKATGLEYTENSSSFTAKLHSEERQQANPLCHVQLLSIQPSQRGRLEEYQDGPLRLAGRHGSDRLPW